MTDTYVPTWPVMGRAELAQHEIPAESFRGQLSTWGGDGYDRLEHSEKAGWQSVSSWGHDGWDLGDWPYVVIKTAKHNGRFLLAVDVEGDLTVYGFDSEANRESAIDYLFLWYADGRRLEEILANEGLTYDRDALDAASLTVEERFRGPFSWKRLEASKSEVTA